MSKPIQVVYVYLLLLYRCITDYIESLETDLVITMFILLKQLHFEL